jgi:hypothetical protein
MSEDQPAGFRAEPAGNGLKRIREIGRDQWLVKKLSGTVILKRADAGSLKITALDANGMPTKELGSGGQIKLQEDVIYYLIAK